MPDDRRNRAHVDRDGVTVTRTGNVRTGVWLLVLALALVAVTLFVVVGPLFRGHVAAPQRPEPAQSAARKEDSGSRVARAGDATTSRRPELPPAAERPRAPQDQGATSADDPHEAAADGTQEEGPSGIALFPPPGTDPIKPGIVVPDGFDLPPGFVRHYQVTDDGKELPAILMFHPDYAPVDAHGEKIALPADRVVPPDMAPPGLPIRTLEVPDDTVPMIEGPNDRAGTP